MFLHRSPLSEAHKKRFLKSRKKISKNFEKGIDKSIPIVYNIKCSRQRCQRKPRRPSSSNKTKVFNMRKWRNWQTRTFEGRVVHTVRVQVPFLAPNQKNGIKDAVLLVLYELTDAEPLRPSGRTLDALSLNSGNIYLERQARVLVPFLAPKRTPDGVLFSCEK